MDQGLLTALQGEMVGAGTEPPELKKISSPEEAEKLTPGTEFLDPEGKKRIVPYRPKTLEEADVLPEGVQFLDPEGKLRQTPTYEGIDFTAQTLYDMAATDKEREKALERSYPGKVKRLPRTNELYVEDEGKLRKPKGFMEAPGAFLTAQAAPVGGSVIGEIGGGLAGSAVLPGAGTFGGAVGGGAAGGAVGQAFNDAILSLAGVYDRSKSEEAAELGLSGLFGGAGTAAGRVISGAAPIIKDTAANVLPKFANWVAGTNEEALGRGVALREQGVLVPPSPMFPEVPHVINVVEVFDPAFHTQKPLLQSATDYYEKTGTKLLKDVGVEAPGKITDPEAAVSTEKAGTAILQKTTQESVAAEAKLQVALDARKADIATGAMQKAASIESLRTADAEARAAADKVITAGFDNIQSDIDKAMAVAKSGYNSGDLWNSVGEKLAKIRLGISLRASQRYAQADQLAAGHLPNIEDLPETAREMLAQMPDGFEGKYPGIVKQIRDLAGVPELDANGMPTGNWVKEPANPTFGQLHNLRTVLRNSVNYYDLTPDFREGALKFFAGRVNDVLHDINAVPELKAAASFLDETDKWYGKVIKPLNDKNIQAVMNGLESGLPADPKKLYDVLIREGRTELTNKVKKMVGPSLWGGIKAADIKEMLDNAKTLTPGEIDGRQFVKQVLDRYRTGMLEAVHGGEATRLMEQAQRVAQLDGRLPIKVVPGDTVSSVIAKARETAEALKAAAKQDPLGMLNKEMKILQREQQREAARLRKLRQNDPLGFLYNPTTGASEAVDHILRSEDLILAAAGKFGEQSPEFGLLRQVWAERLLTGTLRPSERLAKVSEEVQQLMFPGVSLDAMREFAKNMDFLMSARGASIDPGAGLSMAATAKVEHPFGALPGGKTLGKVLNIATLGLGAPVARTILGAYYKLIRNAVNNPAFLRWMQKGLKGDEQARQMVKAAIQRRMQRGGAVGAAAAESQFQTPNQQTVF